MIPIIQFSWQGIRLFQNPNVSVGQLHDLAQESNPELFLFHDPDQHLSAVVIPELVTETVEKLDLPLEELAAAIGLLDLIRQDQMTVQEDQPASLVASLASWQEASTVIVVDYAAVPVGLFIPNVVVERLPQTGYFRYNFSEQLQRTVRRFLENEDLPEAITDIESEHDEFHSEQLNLLAPDPYVCQNHGKPHKWHECPCKRHPSASCTRRMMRTQ